jgi:hypothetical protein
MKFELLSANGVEYKKFRRSMKYKVIAQEANVEKLSYKASHLDLLACCLVQVLYLSPKIIVEILFFINNCGNIFLYFLYIIILWELIHRYQNLYYATHEYITVIIHVKLVY